MSKSDKLHRFIFENMSVRGELIHLDKTYFTIINQHDYPDTIKQILGEALCIAGLLSAIIKFKGRLTVQFRGEGKLKLLLAQSDDQFHMRALAKWDGVNISQDELIASFQKGVLMIMLDSGPSQQRYQGIVAWEGNSLAESIQGYFKNSEQLATKIWLAVSEVNAAGMLLQIIPDQNKHEKVLDQASLQPQWEHANQLASQLTDHMLLNTNPEVLLRNLYPDDEIRLFPEIPIEFRCTCSRKKSEEAIGIIGREEAEEELKDKNSIVVTCDFCNKEYIFDRVDVAAIFENKGTPPTTLH